MEIRVELLSDLCSYSGEVYNTTVDTDVVYDKYGIPYIPAKRIKGCIREAALELKDLGLLNHYIEIFGEEGYSPSCFTLSNAHIENYEAVVNTLKSFKYKEITEAEKVLQQYTYTRTQTKINEETGAALENSLRTMRVVKKGLVFYAELDFRQQEYLQEFKDAVSIVKHMGVSRTRGLGLVNLSIIEGSTFENHILCDVNTIFDKNKIEYSIHLKSPIICKSPLGNQAKSEEYIAGSKVLGLIAGYMSKEEYFSIMHDIIVSNAYIVCDKQRTLPGKKSLQKIKNQKYDASGAMDLVDMLYFTCVNDTEQRSPAKIHYMNNNHKITSVATEVSYHHQRPENKAIGRATEKDGEFYQLGSICEGQTFKGAIYANKEVTKKILAAVSKMKKIRMGYGKNSEFGQVDFTLDSIHDVNCNPTLIHDCEIFLASDVILYNEQGMLVADVKALESYLKDAFKVSDMTISKPFVEYSTIGGFNVTWHRRKPTFSALEKGSVMLLHSDTGFIADYDTTYFIGERISEGYGEILLFPIGKQDFTVYKYQQEETIISKDKQDTKILYSLLEKECEKEIDVLVRAKVQDFYDIHCKGFAENYTPAVAKIRLLYKTSNTYEDMEDQIRQLANESKASKTDELISQVTYEVVDKAEEGTRKWDSNFKLEWDNQKKFKYLYNVYITELKYQLKKDGGTNE